MTGLMKRKEKLLEGGGKEGIKYGKGVKWAISRARAETDHQRDNLKQLPLTPVR